MSSRQKPSAKQPVLKGDLDKRIRRARQNAIESKSYPSFGVDSVGISGVITHVSGMAAGFSPIQRVGTQVTLKEYSLRAALYVATSDLVNLVRVVVFRWKPDGGVAPTLPQILDNASSSVCYPTEYPYNWAMRDAFEILSDQTVHLEVEQTSSPVTPQGSGGYSSAYLELTVPLGDRKLNFTPGANTGRGQIFVLMVSDSYAISHPSVRWAGRLVYGDG